MGLALKSCCRFDEDLVCYQKAVHIDMLKPEHERNKILHIRHLNLGSAYCHLKQYDKAETHIENGRDFAIQTFGQETYYESMQVSATTPRLLTSLSLESLVPTINSQKCITSLAIMTKPKNSWNGP